jgi:hypothetical protein
MNLSFQRITIVIFIVLLIGILIFLAYMISKSKSGKPWPPIVSSCPDYWEDIIPEGKTSETYIAGSNCTNTKHLGSPLEKSMDFSANEYIGANGLCNKYTWAKDHEISWDGITYGVPNPCSS